MGRSPWPAWVGPCGAGPEGEEGAGWGRSGWGSAAPRRECSVFALRATTDQDHFRYGRLRASPPFRFQLFSFSAFQHFLFRPGGELAEGVEAVGEVGWGEVFEAAGGERLAGERGGDGAAEEGVAEVGKAETLNRAERTGAERRWPEANGLERSDSPGGVPPEGGIKC